jgi:hypothetical protein
LPDGARAVLLAALALVAGGCGGPLEGGALESEVTGDARSPRVPASERVRVLVEFQRDSLGDRLGTERLNPREQRAYVRSLRREARASLSALRARGVRLREVATFERAWNGFAATVDAGDLPEVGTLGLRAEPVRRFFPATSAPAEHEAGAPETSRPPAGAPTVAVIGEPDVIGALVPGRPLLHLPIVGEQRNRETGAPERVATSDALIAALERAVDPDEDGDVDDHVQVALAAVASPYASFEDSPEAKAVAAATAAGTLVVAPAGHDGPRAERARFGTVASPGAARQALAVAALRGAPDPAPPSIELGIAGEDGRERLAGRLLAGGGQPRRLALADLSGPSQADPRFRGRADGDAPLEYFTVDARPRARGRAVVVRSGPSLADVATAAAGAGAAVVIVCDPHGRGAAPTAAATGITVIALNGEAARRALELSEDPGGEVFLARAEPRRQSGPRAPAVTASMGPTYGLMPKPDVAAPGSAVVPLAGGRSGVVSGSGVAAARVASLAAELRERLPGAAPEEIAARLVAGARRAGPPAAAGAGVPDMARSLAARRPPAWPAEAGGARRPPAPVLGSLALSHDGDRVVGVRFAAGRVRRMDDALAIEPIGRLVLELAPASGGAGRELTPPGGALHLLPGEYAYTLTDALLDDVPTGRYRFVVSARGPAGGTGAERRSESFELR